MSAKKILKSIFQPNRQRKAEKAYTAYAQKCVEELKIVQEKFRTTYNIDAYENWFYNQTTGLLTFNTGADELNFRFFDLGSFSEKSQTWKWAWDNDTTLDAIKKESFLVKEFGQKYGFEKLTTGYFPSNEIEAWEFTAIAMHVTEAIGAYRPVNDQQLKIFFLVTEPVDNATASNIKNSYIRCADHEYRRVAFVCQHLNKSTPVGFEEAFTTWEDMPLGEDDDFQAWCNDCEAMRQKTSGWNEESEAFANIKAVCEQCYFEMKELNLGHR